MNTKQATEGLLVAIVARWHVYELFNRRCVGSKKGVCAVRARQTTIGPNVYGWVPHREYTMA